MANRKVTPLKDEPGTSLEDIQVGLSTCIQAVNALTGKIDRSLSLVQLSRTLGTPQTQAHLSSLISDRDETRTEVGQSVGLTHGSTSSNEWQHEASASSPVGSDNVASDNDGENSSFGSNIVEAVAEVILQPTVAHTSGGGGGSNDRGWNDEDKEKNKRKRNGGMRR